jgi:hypothetical protein
VWGWLGGYALAREYATQLFDRVTAATVPTRFEHTAVELNALLATMSFWGRLSRDQRQALERENERLYERLDRHIRSSTAATLVTARRAGANRQGGEDFEPRPRAPRIEPVAVTAQEHPVARRSLNR